MFSRFARLPLRRCLHTAAPRTRVQNRLPLALATGAVATTYLAWRLNSDSAIALDSTSKLSAVKTNAPKPPESAFLANDEPAPSHPTLSSEASSEPETNTAPSSEASETTTTTESGAEQTQEANAAGGGGAFNPVTGEINWDCPCLGGMAHGPCGPQFREAFSCFVFSEEEPKGINCVDKFKAMQTCFREHPDVYGDEIDDDDEAEAGNAHATSSNAEAESNGTNDTIPKSTSAPESTTTHTQKELSSPDESTSS